MVKIEPYCAQDVFDPPAYFQAVKVTGAQTILFLSGQVAYDPKGHFRFERKIAHAWMNVGYGQRGNAGAGTQEVKTMPERIKALALLGAAARIDRGRLIALPRVRRGHGELHSAFCCAAGNGWKQEADGEKQGLRHDFPFV